MRGGMREGAVLVFSEGVWVIASWDEGKQKGQSRGTSAGVLRVVACLAYILYADIPHGTGICGLGIDIM